MKFLLDVCASSISLQGALLKAGHDVTSMVNIEASASDESVLELSRKENRILITKDKDFGELIFVRGLPHPAIIRLIEMKIAEEIKAVQELIARYSEELKAGAIFVVSKDRIRITPKP